MPWLSPSTVNLMQARKCVVAWKSASVANCMSALIRGAAYDKGVVRGHSLGKTEGLAKGKAEGRAEGEGMGIANSIKTFLAVRFGTVPDELLVRIDAVSDLETLQQLLAVTATATSLADFAAHLLPA
ncbi:MAG: hypothetical protein CVV41_02455 [Candidatus Riflebacteria bacterium HGW-Riflebacteria-1]|nr:MAG: hypothetical protein CVV41_02455 [Candidatus Riflebacteria bacterium HGW-Riflebacteria-1]